MKILAAVLITTLLYSCDDEKEGDPTGGAASTVPAASHPGNKPKEEQVGPTTDAKKAGSAQPSKKKKAGTCPAGKWRYDYADAFMRTFIEKNMKGAKVLESKGSYICEFPAGKSGEASCAAIGGPVITEVAFNQGGLKMQMRTEVNGGSTMQVEIADGTIEVKESDLSKIDMKATATLNGNEIPVPFEDVVSLVPEGTSQMSYKCEGDTLSLLIEAEGVESDWQELKRAK